MSEPMSDERLAKIRAEHATYLRDVQRFGLSGLVRGAQIRMQAIGELLAEVDRLRALPPLLMLPSPVEISDEDRERWQQTWDALQGDVANDSIVIRLSPGEIRVPEDCPVPDDTLRKLNQ